MNYLYEKHGITTTSIRDFNEMATNLFAHAFRAKVEAGFGDDCVEKVSVGFCFIQNEDMEEMLEEYPDFHVEAPETMVEAFSSSSLSTLKDVAIDLDDAYLYFIEDCDCFGLYYC